MSLKSAVVLLVFFSKPARSNVVQSAPGPSGLYRLPDAPPNYEVSIAGSAGSSTSVYRPQDSSPARRVAYALKS